MYGSIYNLSETELKALKEYINKMLAKGFIRPSKSPFGSLVLFVKKSKIHRLSEPFVLSLDFVILLISYNVGFDCLL